MGKKQRLKNEAQQRGVPLEILLEQDLEQRWKEQEIPLQFQDILSLGMVESDFQAEDSEAWLFKQWSAMP